MLKETNLTLMKNMKNNIVIFLLFSINVSIGAGFSKLHGGSNTKTKSSILEELKLVCNKKLF